MSRKRPRNETTTIAAAASVAETTQNDQADAEPSPLKKARQEVPPVVVVPQQPKTSSTDVTASATETEQDKKVEQLLQQQKYKKKPDKRQKKKKKPGRPCHSWAKTGVCEYGTTCKFTHELVAKGQGVDPTSYGAPWPESRDPFGDVVARNYSELLLERESPALSSSSSSSSSSLTAATSLTTTSIATTSIATTTPPANKTTVCLNQYVHYHPNHLCVIGIASTHAALNNDSPITRVTYRSSGSGVNMTDIKMSGKKKAGSLKVRANTVLCDVVLENGLSYEVVAGIDGALIEANKRIVENPTLLCNDPRYRGYIGIIQQKKDRVLKRDLGSLVLVGGTRK